MIKDTRERRKYPRYEISFPISFRVSGLAPVVSKAESIEGIGTRTTGKVGNISLEGLLIEANPTRDQVGEIIRAKQGDDRFDIEIETSLGGESVKVTGKVVWYDINFLEEAPYHFRAGIFLEEMDLATRRVWKAFISRARG
ncbi:MAG: PilZ domain-containing protein [Deltaproteobacteria bacterium]|nr:PilZ domain-containing protein [Deltaproteobacteria bacterium]